MSVFDELREKVLNKIILIRKNGKCSVEKYDIRAYEFVKVKEISEELFLEYKSKYLNSNNTEYVIYDFDEPIFSTNKEIFTFSCKNDEVNIVKENVVYFSKSIQNSPDGKEITYYKIILRDNIRIYLPNEDIYYAFCKWMKGE